MSNENDNLDLDEIASENEMSNENDNSENDEITSENEMSNENDILDLDENETDENKGENLDIKGVAHFRQDDRGGEKIGDFDDFESNVLDENSGENETDKGDLAKAKKGKRVRKLKKGESLKNRNLLGFKRMIVLYDDNTIDKSDYQMIRRVFDNKRRYINHEDIDVQQRSRKALKQVIALAKSLGFYAEVDFETGKFKIDTWKAPTLEVSPDPKLWEMYVQEVDTPQFKSVAA